MKEIPRKKLAANYDEFDELPQIFDLSFGASRFGQLIVRNGNLGVRQNAEFLLYSRE